MLREADARTKDGRLIRNSLKRASRCTLAAVTLVLLPASISAQLSNQQSSLLESNGNGGSSNGNGQSNNSQRQQTQVDNPYSSGQQIMQPFRADDSATSALSSRQAAAARDGIGSEAALVKQPPKPGEFELYVQRQLGRKLPRFGTEFVLPSLRDFAAPATATIPPDYIVQPGDTIVISLAGSMEGSVSRVVDNDGKIFLSGVGPVKIAGVRHSDLHDVIAQAIGTQFRGFIASVNIEQLRGIRIYVTGLANNPGAFTVSSLSTLANAVLQAGGPSSGGSWRNIKLYRNGRELTTFDLYKLMRTGRRVDDFPLQNEDVLFIPPAGEQVAVIGSVQEEAIYEAKPGETLANMLAAAGGPNTLADQSRVIVYHAGQDEISGPQQLDYARAASIPVKGGDIIQLLSSGSLIKPTDQQPVLVRIEGEVLHPGIYYFPHNTPIADIIGKAGGLTPTAYAFGTRFTRQSVKIQQQEAFREALRQLELSLAAAPLTASSSLSDAQRSAQISGAQSVLERLRQAEPDGRVVLQLSPDASSLPGSILLENNDAIFVPPRPSTVGVFGAINRPASFLVDGNSRLKVSDYIEKAGGTLRAADRRETFVVRANGEVLSRKRGALNARILPGDVIFVPVKTQSGTFWARFKDLTTTLFSLGLGAATVVAVTK